MWRDSWVAFDTETTGLNKFARVLEIGIVYFEHGEVADTWSTFLNPPDLDWNHPEVLEALKVNGLSKKDVAGAPQFHEIVGELTERLHTDVWVGHNLEFDVRMLSQEFERIQRPWDFRPPVSLCTQRLSYRLHPQEKSHKLVHTAERWQVEQPSAHRAVVDATTCGKVLAKMLQKLPEEDTAMVSFQKEAAAAWARRPRGR
jgi:DNA polymerase III epsilon subunit family exonuclease